MWNIEIYALILFYLECSTFYKVSSLLVPGTATRLCSSVIRPSSCYHSDSSPGRHLSAPWELFQAFSQGLAVSTASGAIMIPCPCAGVAHSSCGSQLSSKASWCMLPRALVKSSGALILFSSLTLISYQNMLIFHSVGIVYKHVGLIWRYIKKMLLSEHSLPWWFVCLEDDCYYQGPRKITYVIFPQIANQPKELAVLERNF